MAGATPYLMSEALRQTPLKEFHARFGARFVPFAGWEMPVQYTGILEEHTATRQTAGLFDVSHMGEAVVSGRDTWRFLDYLLTNRVDRLKPGRAVYSPICYPDGGCVDDLIVYYVSETEAFICMNASNAAKDVAWMQEQVAGFDCEVRDGWAEGAEVALQGPRARPILDALCPEGQLASTLKRFRFRDQEVAGCPVRLSATGYTGETGVEIYCRLDDALRLAEAILEAGESEGLRLVGLGARDSLRLEAGFPLYGHEISENISPIEGGISWAVKLQKGDFIGRAALQAQADNPETRQLHFFILQDRRIAREGTPVFVGDQQVGEVRSGTQSPVLQHPIGSALLAPLPDGAQPEVEIRKRRYPMELRKPPLHLADA